MSRSQDPLTMDFLLLGIIDRQPTHAYDLYKQVTSSEELKTLWTFRQSRLYAVLDKIERSGMISTAIDADSTLPVRKICTITPVGKSAFENWLHTPVSHMNEIRSDFLGKLYFLKDRPKGEQQKVLEAQKKQCEIWLQNIEKKLSEHPGSEDYLHMIYSFRAEFIRSALRWLDEIKTQQS
ncbi:MAG: PadR family transcriptional regulator [Anaerolineaceae bacterium]|nr:PadR family transcriptional regulator [Anaerolineaceae bacterium]